MNSPGHKQKIRLLPYEEVELFLNVLKLNHYNATNTAKYLNTCTRTIRNRISYYRRMGHVIPAGKSHAKSIKHNQFAHGPKYLERVELREIVSALVLTKGVKAHAAAALGITHSTLLKKLKKFDLLKEWNNGPGGKPPSYCVKCNGRMHARSWFVKHVIHKGPGFLIRIGPRGNLWVCVKLSETNSTYAKAKALAKRLQKHGKLKEPVSPVVTKERASEIRKKIRKID